MLRAFKFITINGFLTDIQLWFGAREAFTFYIYRLTIPRMKPYTYVDSCGCEHNMFYTAHVLYRHIDRSAY